MKYLTKYIITITLFLLFSCKQSDVIGENDKHKVINLPETDRSYYENQWGVTKYDSLRLRQDPVDNSTIVNHLRRATLVEILSRKNEIVLFDGTRDYWYYINYDGQKGWIFGSYLHIYNTYEEAFKMCEWLIYGESNLR